MAAPRSTYDRDVCQTQVAGEEFRSPAVSDQGQTAGEQFTTIAKRRTVRADRAARHPTPPAPIESCCDLEGVGHAVCRIAVCNASRRHTETFFVNRGSWGSSNRTNPISPTGSLLLSPSKALFQMSFRPPQAVCRSFVRSLLLPSAAQKKAPLGAKRSNRSLPEPATA